MPLAQGLLCRGVVADPLVGVVVATRGSHWRRRNGNGAVIAMLGIMQAGCRFFPERGLSELCPWKGVSMPPR